IIAMINVTVSLYYYLLVVKAAYLDEPPETPAPLTLSLPVRTLTIVLVVLTVLGGIYPNPLMNLARDAAAALM
ncbi:MAG: NADH-quinone oxidoreductase subunit N, partial [Desulfobacteraceae bacterium]|nr:NADH-quinone oxidoreductase subunit N [Desulfobacteraceae bacterium]